MSDIIDQANDAVDVFFSASLSQRASEGPPYSGVCHNCEKKVDFPLRWCDPDCRDDWEKRQNIRKQASIGED